MGGRGAGEEERDKRKRGGWKRRGIRGRKERDKRKEGGGNREGGKRGRRKKTKYTTVIQPSTSSSLPPLTHTSSVPPDAG